MLTSVRKSPTKRRQPASPSATDINVNNAALDSPSKKAKLDLIRSMITSSPDAPSKIEAKTSTSVKEEQDDNDILIVESSPAIKAMPKRTSNRITKKTQKAIVIDVDEEDSPPVSVAPSPRGRGTAKQVKRETVADQSVRIKSNNATPNNRGGTQPVSNSGFSMTKDMLDAAIAAVQHKHGNRKVERDASVGSTLERSDSPGHAESMNVKNSPDQGSTSSSRSVSPVDDDVPVTDPDQYEEDTQSQAEDDVEKSLGLEQGLVNLDDARSLTPFQWIIKAEGVTRDNFVVSMVTLSSLMEVFSDASIASIVRGLSFSHSRSYVNFARFDTSSLVPDKENRRILFAADNKPAIGIMVGIVSCSNLSEPMTWSNNNGDSSATHEVTIMPFAIHFPCDCTTWGKLFGFQQASATIFTYGISFTTRAQTAKDRDSSMISPTKKTTKVLTRPGFATVGYTPSSAGAYTSSGSLGFNDRVPIYDGRSNNAGDGGFSFSDADFAKLSKWDKWPQKDVPLGAAVALGYSPNRWKDAGSSEARLSTNLLFVIVLALQKNVVD